VKSFECPEYQPRYDDACPCYEILLPNHDPGLPHGAAWDRMSDAEQDQVIADGKEKQARRVGEVIANRAQGRVRA
jgi:hypothetical protein